MTAAAKLSVSNEQFLSAIFGTDADRAHVCAFPGDPDKVTNGHWKGGFAKNLKAQIAKPEYNAFFSTALFREDEAGKAARKKGYFDELYVVIVDDVGTKVDPSKIALAPTWKLETSEGNYQVGYCLSVPERDQRRAEVFLAALVDKGLTDKGGNNIVRYARLPVGTNNKTKCGASGFRHELHCFDPDVRYTLDEMIDGFGLAQIGERDKATTVDRETAFNDLRDIAEQLSKLTKTSPGWHNLITRACASLVMRGVPDVSIRFALSTCCRNGWDDPDLTNAIESARKKYNRPDPNKLQPSPLEIKAKPIGLEILTGPEPRSIPCLVPGIIPVSAHRINGPGGIAKSSFTALQAANNIVGREVFGLPSERHGPVLFITGEDDEYVFKYRLRKMLDAAGYTEHEKRLVAEHFLIKDVSGQGVPLNELDDRGNIIVSRHVEALIRAYQSEGLAWVIMDPVAYFIVGERYVNDAESAVNKASLQISTALTCAVGLIGHMSQAAVREKTDDQYAGRGGAAGADNARAVMNFHHFGEEDSSKQLPPPGIEKAAIVGGRVARVNFPKFSHGPRERRSLFVQRGDITDPWRFDAVFGEPATRQAIKEAKQRANDQRLDELTAAVKDLVAAANRPSRNEIATQLWERRADVSRDVARAAVARAVETGAIIEEPLPEGERGRNRFFYLRCL